MRVFNANVILVFPALQIRFLSTKSLHILYWKIASSYLTFNDILEQCQVEETSQMNGLMDAAIYRMSKSQPRLQSAPF